MDGLTSNGLLKCNISSAYSLLDCILTLWQYCFLEKCVTANQKTTISREGKDVSCLVSHWLILPLLDSWIWLSYSMYHRMQTNLHRSGGLDRPTVAVVVTQAGFPFQYWVTGTEYPASLDCGLFPVSPAQGKEGRNNHIRANSWQRCSAWGQAGRGSPQHPAPWGRQNRSCVG